MLSIKEDESFTNKSKRDNTNFESDRSTLFAKVKEAETKLVHSSSDAVEESLVIIGPHGLNPKVKRLVLKSYCLTLLGYKSGKCNRQWPLEDIVKVKRHPINHNCFTISCLERKKKKIKTQSYSFEVRSEIECWRWMEILTKATTALLNEKSKGPDSASNRPTTNGVPIRSRSTSAPPAVLPQALTHHNRQHMREPGKVSDEEDDDSDAYADPTDDDEDEDRVAVGKEKELHAQSRQRKSVSPAQPPSPAMSLSTPPRSLGATGAAFNPFGPAGASLQHQPSSPYAAVQPQQPVQYPQSHIQQQPQQGFLQLPPTSGGASPVQMQLKPEEASRKSSPVYITTMSPPAHMRIVQDLGLISATGTATAPTSATQCGPQVEAALHAARQELMMRAASRGGNAVFQTCFSTAFHQWGVTVLACGTACVATMIT